MITVLTNNPTGLLSAIKKEIEQNKIQTWDCDKDGDFTHNPEQWNKKAWLRPSITDSNDRVEFIIVWPKDSLKEKAIVGVYQGRFIEMLTSHFPERCIKIESVI